MKDASLTVAAAKLLAALRTVVTGQASSASASPLRSAAILRL